MRPRCQIFSFPATGQVLPPACTVYMMLLPEAPHTATQILPCGYMRDINRRVLFSDEFAMSFSKITQFDGKLVCTGKCVIEWYNGQALSFRIPLTYRSMSESWLYQITKKNNCYRTDRDEQQNSKDRKRWDLKVNYSFYRNTVAKGFVLIRTEQ